MKKMMIYTDYKKLNIKNLLKDLNLAGDMIYLFSIFISGLLIGAALISVSLKLSIQLNNLFNIKLSITSIFLKSLIFGFIMITVNLYSGFNCFGSILSSATVFINGIYNGLLLSSLISLFGFNGFVSYLLLEFPSQLCISVITLKSSLLSAKMSKSITRLALYNLSSEYDVKIYLKHYLVYILCILTASLISIISHLLFGNINFS